MNRDVKRLVANLVKKFGTRDPYEIAKQLGIQIQIGFMGSHSGCYMYLKKHRCIFLNEKLSEHEMLLVMAHELGHAIMHKKENCYFKNNCTLLLNTKTEIDANKFAIELLIKDEDILEYYECNTSQLSFIFGYHKRLIELKLKDIK